MSELEDVATFFASSHYHVALGHALGVVFFVLVRLLCTYACHLYGIRPGTIRHTIAGSLSAYMHAVPVLALALYIINKRQWPLFDPNAWETIDLCGRNSEIEILAIIYCNSFMVYDTLAMVLTSTTETLYVLHHVGVVTSNITCLLSGRGALSIILCLWWGEVTNPIQNAWIVTCSLCELGEKRHRLRRWLTIATIVELSLVRFVYAPWGVLWVMWNGMVFDPSQGASHVSQSLRLLWCTIPALVVGGSVLFVRGLATNAEFNPAVIRTQPGKADRD